MHLRDATTSDLGLLTDLLLAAYNWTGEERVTRDDLRADPHATRYLEGWKRPSDLGLVAVGDDPGGDDCWGAVWARLLPASAPGYGWVADDVPEISMAVVPGRRGHGVGAALLHGLVEQARSLGRPALSLSVEDGNAAARALYERFGFRVVGRTGGSDTMVRTLGPR